MTVTCLSIENAAKNIGSIAFRDACEDLLYCRSATFGSRTQKQLRYYVQVLLDRILLSLGCRCTPPSRSTKGAKVSFVYLLQSALYKVLPEPLILSVGVT